MTDESSHTSPPLEQAIIEAYQGNRQAVKDFFQLFLKEQFCVLERVQEQGEFKHATYPNSVLNVLAIQREDVAIVPIFSRAELIETWCGKKLAWRSMTGSALLKIIPEEWHLCVNPAADVEKEITAWEANLLRHGESGLEELLSEVHATEKIRTLRVEPTDIEKYQKLIKELTAKAHSINEVNKLYLINEIGSDINGSPTETLLLGIALKTIPDSKLRSIEETFQKMLDISLIGDIPGKAVAGCLNGQSVLLEVFQSFDPIYSRSFLAGILKIFKRKESL